MMQMVHETVINLGYEDTMTEIYSVDSQYSKDGGVVVQVTGALQAKEKDRRPFVQTFFLAVQEKGYFVLNDIFRYLLPPGVISEMLDKEKQVEEEEALASTHASVGDKTEEQPEDTASTSAKLDMEGLAINETEEKTPSPSSALEAARAAAAAATSDGKDNDNDESTKDLSTTTTTISKELHRQISGGPSAVPTAPGVTVPFGALVPGEVQGGTAGANGVSIVYGAQTRLSDNYNPERHSSPEDDDDTATATSAAPPRSGGTTGTARTAAAGGGIRPPPPPPRLDGSTNASVSSVKSLDSPGHDSMDPPPNEGVFIRDIPQSVTLEQLAEALSQYGPLATGTLSLKFQSNRDSFAFVDYQNAEDAAECLAHGIELYGRRVTVDIKRPHIFKSSGGAMRNNSSSANSHSSSMSGSGGGGGNVGYPGSPMHMQYPAPPMHLQQQHYQQFYQREQQQQQHNARVGVGGAATGYSSNNRQHMGSNGRGGSMGAGTSIGGGGHPNQMPHMHGRNAMPIATAAAYQMPTAGGYPMMMYNPGMAGMHEMTYIQMPSNQAAMMMAADSSGLGGVNGGIDSGYIPGMQMQGNRGNRGGANGRYDNTGGRGGGGGGSRGGGGQQRGSDQQNSHSPYGRAGVGPPMPYA